MDKSSPSRSICNTETGRYYMSESHYQAIAITSWSILAQHTSYPVNGMGIYIVITELYRTNNSESTFFGFSKTETQGQERWNKTADKVGKPRNVTSLRKLNL